jgi:flagellar motor switch protein FliM
LKAPGEVKENQQSAGREAASSRTRIIHPCNFRYAGRLSNENARFLTALHEKFALNVSTALELYLGASLRLTLVSLKQLAVVDYVPGIAANNYLLPCAIDVTASSCLLEIDISLVCPIIDLLLGGTGKPLGGAHELTEVDEGIMETVSTLVVQELERAWSGLDLHLAAGHPVKPGMVQQSFSASEKFVLLMFEMAVGETTGGFNIALPTPFVGFLLRHLKASLSQKVTGVRMARGPSLRDRILDCNFLVSGEVVDMRVPLKNLLHLKPGTILKTGMPVKNSARLTVDGREIFEALLVRVGRKKAAQLTIRTQEPEISRV